jgi:sulfur-carrier protein
LKSLAGDQSQHQVDGATVDDLLRAIEADHPEMRGWILDERGVLRRHINVFVNGEPGAQDTHVESEDKIDVLPALSGGA